MPPPHMRVREQLRFREVGEAVGCRAWTWSTSTDHTRFLLLASVDALLTGHRDAVDPRAEFIKGHLADREGIIALCRERKFDAVMHFAAFSLVGESMKDPSKYFVNNLSCAINLADAAVAGGARHFVFSTQAGKCSSQEARQASFLQGKRGLTAPGRSGCKSV